MEVDINITEVKTYICSYCGKEVTYEGNIWDKARNNWDHIYPKAKYPELDGLPINFIRSCRECNSAKSNKNPLEWLRYMCKTRVVPERYRINYLDLLEKIKNEYLKSINVNLPYLVSLGEFIAQGDPKWAKRHQGENIR